jgi:DNA replication protein DnaC
MQSMGEAIKEAWANLTSCPSDQVHVCPYCNQVVPKKRLVVLGIEKIVQPVCRCEVEAWEREQDEMQERYRKAEVERKFAISSLGERFENCRFETFAKRPGTEKAFRLAYDYAERFELYGAESLLIWGDPGNGKSHLAAAVCHKLKERGKIPVFQTMTELLERIRSTFRQQSKESEREIMTALQDCDLLVLDDIGAEKVTDWTLDVLFRIIDGRYRAKKPTLFTTNFSPTELLHRFQPDKASVEHEIAARRIHDRILEVSVIVENKATSYRLEVAKQRAIKSESPGGQWA